MANITTQDITKFFIANPTVSDDSPFTSIDVVSAIKDSAQKGRIDELVHFIHASLPPLAHSDPNLSIKQLMVMNYSNLSIMAFSADNPDKETALPSDILLGYSDPSSCGPTMRVLKHLAYLDGVDLIEILKEGSPYTTYRIVSH